MRSTSIRSIGRWVHRCLPWTVRSEIGAVEARLARIEAHVESVDKRLTPPPVHLSAGDWARYGAVLQAGHTARVAKLAAHRRGLVPVAPAPTPSRLMSFEQALDNLRVLRPELFDTWLRLFHQGARSYYDLPMEASCSTWNNEFAVLFKHYVDAYAEGTVLDIGCGPRVVPSYLSTFDPKSVAAIEPLELTFQPPFEVVRAVAEYLPWEDDSFDTVISSTSLDHVLSLRETLKEIRRVMTSGGVFVTWLSSFDGAVPYDERSARELDEYHLFHFNIEWALPLFGEFFDVVDLTRFRHVGAPFEHCFIALRKRTG